MIKLFTSYFLNFAHPMQALDYYLNNIPIKNAEENNEKLRVTESILCSWVFHIIKGILAIGFYFLISKSLSSYVPIELKELEKILPSKLLTPTLFFVFSLAQDIIFFPIATFITLKVLAIFVRLFAAFTDKDVSNEQIDQVFTVALSSHVLSVIPTVGSTFQYFVFLFYYYLGLKKLLNCSGLFATFIIMTPYLLLAFLGSLLALLLIFALS